MAVYGAWYDFHGSSTQVSRFRPRVTCAAWGEKKFYITAQAILVYNAPSILYYLLWLLYFSIIKTKAIWVGKNILTTKKISSWNRRKIPETWELWANF